MDFSETIKEAMKKKGIRNGMHLHEVTGVSYPIVNRLLKNDTSCRIKDLITVGEHLGIKSFKLINGSK